MNKKYLLIYLLGLILVIIGAVYFLKGNSNTSEEKQTNFLKEIQNQTQVTFSDLRVGQYAIVIGNETDIERITVCDDKDSCSFNKPKQGQQPTTGSTPQQPSGEAPNMPNNQDGAQQKPAQDMTSKIMTSGTITKIDGNSIILTLDSGEAETITMSSSIQINKR